MKITKTVPQDESHSDRAVFITTGQSSPHITNNNNNNNTMKKKEEEKCEYVQPPKNYTGRIQMTIPIVYIEMRYNRINYLLLEASSSKNMRLVFWLSL